MDLLQKFHTKAFTIITLLGFGAIAFFLWIQFTEQTESTITNWASLVLGLAFAISAIICFQYYKKIGDRGGVSKAILNTGIANTLFAIGSIIWIYYNFAESISVPYPSIADVFFLAMSIPYALAVGSLLQIYKTSAKASSIVAASGVFLILVLAMMFFVGKPEISGELSFWENFFNFGFALSDSVYVGGGVALLIMAGGKIYRGILVWVLAMFTITMADLVFSYRTATEIVWNGDIADQLYVLSAIIFTYAVILLSKMPERKSFEI